MKHLPDWVPILCLILFGTLPVLSQPALGQAASRFFFEDFDAAAPPVLPANWLSTEGNWSTSTSVASPGSGENNLTVSGSERDSVRSPLINLQGLTSGSVEYLARRTSTYEVDSLLVLASVDGGATFPVVLLDRGQALPAVGSSYELVSMPIPQSLAGQSQVVFMFVALGGSTSGANIRIDDFSVTGEGDPTSGNSVVAFSASSSTLDPSTNTVDVPVSLDFVRSESLQGLQMEISWDVAALDLIAVEAGSAISDSDEWSLSFAGGETQSQIVLLGIQGGALPEGAYDPLMTLRFSLETATPELEAVVTLETVLGSLAVRTGDDAQLIRGASSHVISLATGDASFDVAPSSLDFGAVRVDTAPDQQLVVSNSGSAPLVITDVSSSSPVFSITPATATVDPGGTQPFVVTYAPTFVDFGGQTATLSFVHNAPGGQSEVPAAGVGIGGRGDANLDGAVDVVDLVFGIDYVLGVENPGSGQLTSLDLFPFEAPDGALDVRDLTVVVQAILLGAWPDDVQIASTSNVVAHLLRKNPVGSDEIQLGVDGGAGNGVLYLQTSIPVRAIQGALLLNGAGEAQVASDISPDFSAQIHHDVWTGQLRVLGVRMDGGALPAGKYPLVHLLGFEENRDISFQSGVAVGEERQRLVVGWEGYHENAGEEVDALYPTLGTPFPNPYVHEEGRSLRIPLVLHRDDEVQVDVFNVLGQKVIPSRLLPMPAGQHQIHWAGVDHSGRKVVSGFYLIRVAVGEEIWTRTVVVQQ